MVNGTNYMLLGIHNGDQTNAGVILMVSMKKAVSMLIFFVFPFNSLNEAQCGGCMEYSLHGTYISNRFIHKANSYYYQCP